MINESFFDKDDHCHYDQGGQEGSRDARPTSKQGERRCRHRADWSRDGKPTTAKFCREDEDETKVIWPPKISNRTKRERVEGRC